MVTAGNANLSLDNGLKAEVTEDDTKISKDVNKRLTHYRYLRLRLKSDTDLVPVRVWMGERYWEVLVETANIVEEKIIDLCAAHNAVSFDDITTIAFDGLPSGVPYWFSDLTLVRLPSPPPLRRR